MKENINLKRSLILQSFAPLFLLLFIKHFYFRMPILVTKFFECLRVSGIVAVSKAVNHPLFWDLLISAICLIWFLVTLCIWIGFRDLQKAGFRSAGENIVVSEEKRDVGISFLVSFVLPLLVDDVSNLRAFIFFSVMLIMVIGLLIRSNLFYQNPILTLLGYKVCSFKFVDPAKDVEEFAYKEFIGITLGKPITADAAIKRKYIADDVFMIFND